MSNSKKQKPYHPRATNGKLYSLKHFKPNVSYQMTKEPDSFLQQNQYRRFVTASLPQKKKK